MMSVRTIIEDATLMIFNENPQTLIEIFHYIKKELFVIDSI
jgi:hypothetical protein